jgi:hypothetical protein
MKGKQGRRSKQLLHDLKEETGYWNLKRETPCLELGFGEAVDLS